VIVGTLEELMDVDNPWIQEYFRGPRGRAALSGPDKKERN
jgi:phospholipid/cholesterol/gamma-HCH transport system ATP-binding protein